MGVLASLLRQLPLSPAMFYLPVGYLLGPSGTGLVALDPLAHPHVLTLVTEVALLISLFSVGLQMRVPLRHPVWWIPLRLGLTAMLVTIVLGAAACHWLLGLPPGASVLLAAILAPTDPVLASDVQVRAAGDRDRIRFGLTGEGGLNDGTTFPFVMLGLGLLDIGAARAHALPAALPGALWGIALGLVAGWGMGWLVGSLWVNLRSRFRIALGMEEFFALGLIALAYGAASALRGIGFVAVFAAGLAVRHIEFAAAGRRRAPAEVIGAIIPGAEERVAADPIKASAYMTETVLGFNRQMEHLAELAIILLLGVLLSSTAISAAGLLLAALLFLLVRPLSVAVALAGSHTTRLQRVLIGWFGIRGVGTLYYLMFALQFNLPAALAQELAAIVLTVVAASILVHGISATPLMDYYEVRRRQRDGVA